MNHDDRAGVSRRNFLQICGAGAALAAAGGSAALAETKPLLGFSNKSLDFYFFRIMEEASRRMAADQGWDFQAVNANFDSTAQLQQWNSLLLKRPIGMVGDTVDSQAMVSAVKKANAQKIPVSLIDSLATGGDVAMSVAFDNYQGGVMAAETVIELLKKKYNGEIKGTVLNPYGSLKSDAWRARKEGWDATLAKHPGIKHISRPSEGLLKNMLSVTIDTLAEFPELNAIHAPSDTPSRGVVTALMQKDRWKKVGDPDHIIFVNIDGEPIGLQWIREGYMDADISQDAIAYGEIGVEMLAKYGVKGEKVPLGTYKNPKYFWEQGEIVQSETGPRLVIPPFAVTAENVADKRHWGNVAVNDWGIPYQ